MVVSVYQIKLTPEALGHQYSHQQFYSRQINWLFSIAGGNGSVSLWLTQAFGLFPREVLFLLLPKTQENPRSPARVAYSSLSFFPL